MNEHDKSELADEIVRKFKEGHGCTVFDEDSIKGIKAIASMYNDGKKAAKGFTILLICLGFSVLVIAGLKHYFKDF